MKTNLTICVLAFMLIAGSAFADDCYSLPPWSRDSDGATYQEWLFNTDDNNPMPDKWDNPYGDPELCIFPIQLWQEEWGGREGVWPLSGLIVVDIPNNPVENERKFIQIQFIWAGEVGNPEAVPCIFMTAEKLDGKTIPFSDIDLLDMTDVILEETNVDGAGEYWHCSTYWYSMSPNPVFESIWIGSAIMMDKLTVDTLCSNNLPEPTIVATLGMGGLGLFIQRRRRKAVCNAKS